MADQTHRLRAQYNDLSSDYQSGSTVVSATTTTPNDPSLSKVFTSAQSSPRQPRSSLRSPSGVKAVRFRDDPSSGQPAYRDTSPADASSRAALFSRPYTDDPTPEEQPPDQSGLDNQQIHAYHKQVLADQDEQLDVLGQSIGRQRVLGIQMGDELDEQAAMLEDVERGVDRHQGSLDRARDRLGKISRKARDNWNWVTIGTLICILVLLLVVLN